MPIPVTLINVFNDNDNNELESPIAVHEMRLMSTRSACSVLVESPVVDAAVNEYQ
jgi:hypothetical protein